MPELVEYYMDFQSIQLWAKQTSFVYKVPILRDFIITMEKSLIQSSLLMDGAQGQQEFYMHPLQKINWFYTVVPSEGRECILSSVKKEQKELQKTCQRCYSLGIGVMF